MRTLLIVDDEIFTRKAIIDAINWESLGVTSVLEAGSVAVAKDILQENEVDLALIDIEMPGGTGLDLLEWIRNEAELKFPCAFLTCHASFDFAQQALRLGCSDYLLKPIEFEKVEEVARQMIGSYEASKEKDRAADYGQQWLKEHEEHALSFEKEASNTDSITDNLVVYIRSHLSERLTLTELAYQVGLNPNYLNKVFKNRVGETVNKFIINEKMALAAKQLEEGKIKSYAIASGLGYDNYSSFVNMFKKIYGVSPNQYQEEKIKSKNQ